MKKSLALLLALLLCFCLLACAQSAAPAAGESAPAAAQPDSAPSDAVQPDASGEPAASDSGESDSAPTVAATPEGTPLAELGGLIFTYGGYLTEGSARGFDILLHVENTTASDKTFSVEWLAADGCMLLDIAPKTVPAGETADRSINLYASNLAWYGLTVPGELRFSLYVEGQCTEPITVYTDTFGSSQPFVDTENAAVLCDADGITLYCLGLDTSDETRVAFRLYLVNRSGKDLYFGQEPGSMFVNDVAMSESAKMRVVDGACQYKEVYFDKADLSAAGVAEITSVRYTLTYKLSGVENDTPVAVPVVWTAG